MFGSCILLRAERPNVCKSISCSFRFAKLKLLFLQLWQNLSALRFKEGVAGMETDSTSVLLESVTSFLTVTL